MTNNEDEITIMLTNKNITSLLLVALIATTTSAQADLSESLKDLLARMQKTQLRDTLQQEELDIWH